MKLKSVTLFFFLIITGILIFNYANKTNPETTALGWVGISKLPEWTIDKKVETKGGSFTREFIITFSGTKNELNDWIKNEPVFGKAQNTKMDGAVYTYSLIPQQGAQFAEIKIDFLTNQVTIRTYWS